MHIHFTKVVIYNHASRSLTIAYERHVTEKPKRERDFEREPNM